MKDVTVISNLKKLQVFVSSTYEDLIEERQIAVEAILDAGHIPAGMELFKSGKSQMKTILNWIDNSDVYLLILGGRYGSIERESGLSYIQLEYEYALSKGMPVFAIILNDAFLYEKASKASRQGNNNVFEKQNIDKYNAFRSLVESNLLVRYAINKENIGGIIYSQLADIMNDPDYKLIGWIRGNQNDIDVTDMSEEFLKEKLKNIFGELALRNTAIDMSVYTNSISSNIIRMLNIKALLESYQRFVELELLEDTNLVKVTTTRIEKYSYIQENEPYFSLYTEMTKQQADTFRFEKLLINNVDYTSQVITFYSKDENRGQFIYNVKSDFVPPVISSGDVYYKTSYICPVLDFFQTHRLSYPCHNFSASIILKNDIHNLYSVICSTFSSFSKVYYDDFKASEMKNIGICSIQLPNWSLPGAGYAVTIKNKSEENHI